MHGNVREWVRDVPAIYAKVLPSAGGDGLRDGPPKPMRIVRGGGYASAACLAADRISARRFR